MPEKVIEMNKTPNNEHLDTDILQCKVDISRELNTIPLQNDTAANNPETQNNTAKTNTEEIPVNEPDSPKPTTSREETAEQLKTPEIPKFDLAEEMMAEHRRITAIKRKAPGKTKVERLKPKVQPAEYITKRPTPSLSGQDKIIAEIVAKDIERLCQG